MIDQRDPTARVENNLNRRDLLKCVGAGLTAELLSAAGSVLAQESPASQEPACAVPAASLGSGSGKAPFALIVDDGSPVDPSFYEAPGSDTTFLVPIEFTQRASEVFDRFGMRGKFTVIPMPSCLGRIDKSLRRVPAGHLEGFLKVMRERVAPRFDITPEFLTHLNAYSLKNRQYQHVYEDVWITQAPLEEVIDYFVLAFEILKNVGLAPNGITGPWGSGINVERKFAEAVAEADWKMFHRDVSWYFNRSSNWGKPRQCVVKYEVPDRRQLVVSVPANSPDIFSGTSRRSRDERLKFFNNGIDRLISADGRSGRIRELIEAGCPVALQTHWQSLYTQGTALGLDGLCILGERIQKTFGDSIEWVTCSELARRHAATVRADA